MERKVPYKLKFKSIRQKMLFYTFSITMLMAVTALMNFLIIKNTSTNIDYLFEKNVYLEKYSDNLSKLDNYLYDYLSTKSSDSLYKFFSVDSELRAQIELVNRSIFSEEGNIILNDVINLTNEYLSNSEQAVNDKRSRKTNEYTDSYILSKKISGYIDYKLQILNDIQFKLNTSGYLKLSGNLGTLILIDLAIIILVFFISIMFDVWYSFEFTRPILKLNENAEKISAGELSVEDVNVETNDELEQLAETINTMKHNINESIITIQENAKKEAEFNKQKVEYLEMKNSLKSAELKALQAQINPHFLFNTLNAGVQLAMFEDAERTEKFLEKLSEIFRYNLKDINKVVSLEEELRNVENYIYILKIRFGDFFKFKIENHIENIDKIKLPLFTLQPLIENAFMHGIKEIEEGGIIKIIVDSYENYIKIIIEDNGAGISDEKINEIFGDEELKSTKGHGIGIRNVIQRLRLYFQKDVLSIEQGEGNIGTKIIVKIKKI